ncbi:MAG: VanZ family protein [Candidatus Rokuibacteriota bacterium]
MRDPALRPLRPTYWLPPLLWMAVILALSTDAASSAHTSRVLVPLLRWAMPGASPLQIEALHDLARKMAHLTEYAILATLWFWALVRGAGWSVRRAVAGGLGICLIWAAADEFHQTFVLSRTGSLGDIVIDLAGAGGALAVARWGWRTADALTTALLWAAAVGGTLVIAVNLSADVPSGVLWLTVPAAILLLLVRWRRRPP